MQKAQTNERTIMLGGAPRQVLLQTHLPSLTHAEFVPDKTLSGFMGAQKRSFRIRKDSDGIIKQVKIRLPEATPPGDYKGTLKSGTQDYPVAIHVNEKVRLKISPVTLHITGKPGEKVQAQLLLSNKGNVSIEIPERDAVGFYDDDGLEVAFATSYGMKSDDPLVLLKTFIGKLREGHSDLVKIRVLEGAGALPPATQKCITLEIAIPGNAKSKHSFHGVWSLGSVEYALTLTVTI